MTSFKPIHYRAAPIKLSIEWSILFLSYLALENERSSPCFSMGISGKFHVTWQTNGTVNRLEIIGVKMKHMNFSCWLLHRNTKITILLHLRIAVLQAGSRTFICQWRDEYLVVLQSLNHLWKQRLYIEIKGSNYAM